MYTCLSVSSRNRRPQQRQELGYLGVGLGLGLFSLINIVKQLIWIEFFMFQIGLDHIYFDQYKLKSNFIWDVEFWIGFGYKYL